MARPSKKIWCPKCHKRHRLPPNAGGMTLRCRACRFAFRVQDGLTQDPGVVEIVTPEVIQSPNVIDSPNAIDSPKVGSELLPAETAAASATGAPRAPATIEKTVSFDDNYDDILEVLETPESAPLAPPRAHARATAAPDTIADASPDPRQNPAANSQPHQPQPLRQSVTREQLRAHRNARQFWMMMSLLFACVLGVVSWYAVNLLLTPSLSNMERKLLYAIGVPARWLPGQEGEDEILLPPNHVKLRGDHIELADRDDLFRDDFPEPAPQDEQAQRDEIAAAVLKGRVPPRDVPPADRVGRIRPQAAAKQNPPRDKQQLAAGIRNPKPEKAFVIDNRPANMAPKRAGGGDAAGPGSGPPRRILQPADGDPDKGHFPFEISRSPKFGSSLKAIQSLPGKRVAFLTDQKSANQIGIASFADGWKIRMLAVKPGMKMEGFAMSDDLSRVVIFAEDIVQSWEIVNPGSGEARFVAECVLHTSDVSKVALTRSGEKIVSGDEQGKVYASNFSDGTKTGSITGFDSKILDIATRGDEGFVVMDRKGVCEGSGNTKRPKTKIRPFHLTLRGPSVLSEDGSRIAYQLGHRDDQGYTIKVANVIRKEDISSIKTKRYPNALRFSGDRRFLLVQNGREVSVWNWKKKERLRVFRYAIRLGPALVHMDLTRDNQSLIVVTGKKSDQILVFEMPDTASAAN